MVGNDVIPLLEPNLHLFDSFLYLNSMGYAELDHLRDAVVDKIYERLITELQK
jgi:hypothetical protein